MTFGDMRITQREQATLDACYSALDAQQAAEIEEQAFEIAAEEILDVKAAALLLPLLVKIIVRNVRERGGE